MKRTKQEMEAAYRNRSPSASSSPASRLHFHFIELNEFTWTAKEGAQHYFHSGRAQSGFRMLVRSNIYCGIQLAMACIEDALAETGDQQRIPKEFLLCWSALKHLVTDLGVRKITGFEEPVRASFLLLFLATALLQKSFSSLGEEPTPLNVQGMYSASTYPLTDEDKLVVDSLPVALYVSHMSYPEQLCAMAENLKRLSSRIRG